MCVVQVFAVGQDPRITTTQTTVRRRRRSTVGIWHAAGGSQTGRRILRYGQGLGWWPAAIADMIVRIICDFATTRLHARSNM